MARSQVQMPAQMQAVKATLKHISWLLSVPRGLYQDSILNEATAASFHVLFRSLLIILPFDADVFWAESCALE
jgi:hypothetical protein